MLRVGLLVRVSARRATTGSGCAGCASSCIRAVVPVFALRGARVARLLGGVLLHQIYLVVPDEGGAARVRASD